WTVHNTPQRLAVQKRVAADFEEETGISVDIVGMSAEDMGTSIVAGAAAGDVPDVALVDPGAVAAWSSQGLVDTETVQNVVDSLDPSTFSQQALDLVTVDDALGAVPSDGWGELLYYRTDVFDQLGLDAPQSVQDVTEAAQAISESDADITPIVLGTTPGDSMARENLEHLSLANGCQMFDDGQVAFESDACVQTLSNYQTLVDLSVSGDQDVESTRAAYLAGDTAMAMWSPHLLDEIAGLDSNFPVSAEGSQENPDFLAQNTSVVGALTGVANNEATGYGLTLNYAVLKGANTEAAEQYIEYVMSDGYIDTLAMTPEGRAPVRTGTPNNSQQYIEEWKQLPLGADPDNQRPFDDAYNDQVIQAVVTAANSFTRWGFSTEHWATAGAATTENSLVIDFNQLLNGGDPQDYADHMAEITQKLEQENQ